MKNSIILLHLEAKPLRNGKTNPKNYPYINELTKILHDKKFDTALIMDKIPLKQSVHMIKQADHIICIDSYLQHLAWYYGRQAIVLWGPSNPNLFGHKEHINLFKGDEYFRPKQFDLWEHWDCNNDAFVKPLDIIKHIL